MLEKKDLRKKIKSLRLSLSIKEKQTAAEEVFNRLEILDSFKRSNNILVYHSLPDELPTTDFINKWQSTKNLFLPRVNGDDLEILPYRKSELQTGSFDIEEPIGNDIVDVDKIDLIIVPAVGYDKSGNRLGRGKGYYDRMMKSSKAVKIGIGYDFQLFDALPIEPHDIPVDIVITQTSTIITK